MQFLDLRKNAGLLTICNFGKKLTYGGHLYILSGALLRNKICIEDNAIDAWLYLKR